MVRTVVLPIAAASPTHYHRNPTEARTITTGANGVLVGVLAGLKSWLAGGYWEHDRDQGRHDRGQGHHDHADGHHDRGRHDQGDRRVGRFEVVAGDDHPSDGTPNPVFSILGFWTPEPRDRTSSTPGILLKSKSLTVFRPRIRHDGLAFGIVPTQVDGLQRGRTHCSIIPTRQNTLVWMRFYQESSSERAVA